MPLNGHGNTVSNPNLLDHVLGLGMSEFQAADPCHEVQVESFRSGLMLHLPAPQTHAQLPVPLGNGFPLRISP